MSHFRHKLSETINSLPKSKRKEVADYFEGRMLSEEAILQKAAAIFLYSEDVQKKSMGLHASGKQEAFKEIYELFKVE